jgi:hypothetical protein
MVASTTAQVMSTFKIIVAALAIMASAAFIACLFFRRSRLPTHLKPYFKNYAAYEASVEEYRVNKAKRLEELKDPTNSQEAAEYLSLHEYDDTNPVYQKALQMVEEHLKDNPCDYGQVLGEIYYFSKAYRNPEKAYYYYYIGLSQDGYSVGFRDSNLDPPHYCGPIGDFRNESQVSDLVTELGWDKIKQIDLDARKWLTLNGFTVQDFLENE